MRGPCRTEEMHLMAVAVAASFVEEKAKEKVFATEFVVHSMDP